MNLVDTSGWIEYFFAGRNAAFFAGPVEKMSELVVPAICLYEVFKKVNEVAGEAEALQAVAQMKQGRVVELSEAIALNAALVSIKHKLPMADSIVYATGQLEKAIVWTEDEDFRGLWGVKYKKARTRA